MLKRADLVTEVKQTLLERLTDLKWAMAYGDYDEPFQEIAEDIVERILSLQN